MADDKHRIIGNFEKVILKKKELELVRKKSLEATVQGDYRRAAKLTVQAAALNKEIKQLECTLPLP